MRHAFFVRFALLAVLAVVTTPSLFATHCQIHGSIRQGTAFGAGLAGWMVLKTPVEGFGMDTVFTDASGNFEFIRLPGNRTYTIHAVIPSGWFAVDAIPGVNSLDGDSGEVSSSSRIDASTLGVFVVDGTRNTENVFVAGTNVATGYRTFTQDELSQKKSKSGKVTAGQACFRFPETLSGDTVIGLHIKFNAAITSIEDTDGLQVVFDPTGKGKIVTLSGRTIRMGETVTICATFAKKSSAIKADKWNWVTSVPLSPPPKNPPMLLFDYAPIQIEPNGGTVRDYIYKFVISRPAGLVLGIPRPDSPKTYGWIRYLKSDSKDFPHTGPAQCFSFRGQLKNPHVSKDDDHLLGEAHALKLAIIANDNGVTSPDTPDTRLGDLIYFDSSNTGDPCNGLTLRAITLKADSLLTFCGFFSPALYPELDTCISRINRAFDGPYVAVVFNPLQLAGARLLADVPFLHPNGAASPVPFRRVDPSAVAAIPEAFSLEQNYPNPFNPTTTIRFVLEENSVVSLKVYNLLGQEVATLIDHEVMDDGEQEVEFDGTTHASGVYYYRLEAAAVDGGRASTAVKRMLLIK